MRLDRAKTNNDVMRLTESLPAYALKCMPFRCSANGIKHTRNIVMLKVDTLQHPSDTGWV